MPVACANLRIQNIATNNRNEYQLNTKANPMKTIVRAAVVALVLTGAAASTQIASASAQTKVTVAKTSAMPIPMCAPDDPNACGLR